MGSTIMAEPLLEYSDTEDQDYAADATVELGLQPHFANLAAITVAGDPDRPNEDAYAVATEDGVLYLGVFDGITSLKQVAGLADETGARFASHEVQDVFAHAVGAQDPSEILLHCNDHLRAASSEITGVDEADVLTLPSTTATVVRIDLDADTLHLGNIGDGFCVVWYTDGSSELITDNSNAEFDEALFDYIVAQAKTHGISNREARPLPEVQEKLVTSFARKINKPDGRGAGALNGGEHADIYIQAEAMSLAGIRSVLLATDGFILAGGDIEDVDYRYKLEKKIRRGRLSYFIDKKHESEDADPDWEHARYKHSDDATALFLEL